MNNEHMFDSETESYDVDVQDDVTSSSDDSFAEIKSRYEGDQGLTDVDVDAIADLAVSYLRSLLSYFGEENVSVDEYDGDDGELILDISGGDLAVLIGRHGRTLDALQMIVSFYLSNRLHFHYPIIVDIEGYKTRRKDKLVSLAKTAANRACKLQQDVCMAPMNAYERRIVHLALVDDGNVSTHSEGKEPQRRVIVTYMRS